MIILVQSKSVWYVTFGCMYKVFNNISFIFATDLFLLKQKFFQSGNYPLKFFKHFSSFVKFHSSTTLADIEVYQNGMLIFFLYSVSLFATLSDFHEILIKIKC